MSDTERKSEQQHLDRLYSRLDELRVRSERALETVRRAPTVGTPGARSERDAFIALHAGRLAQLRAVEDRLCFGRLDLLDRDRRYVGRIGLSDEEHHQLLLDWRAPAAEPFYRATAVSPAGVVRRRSLATKNRQITGIEDEVLDLDAYDPEQDGPVLSGEGALMVALGAARTGKMRDIVGTIQAEQDRVIRAPLSGVLVVQGAPGTGKTAVALHRTAYLLYSYRDRIASAGVLVVGPNERFLRYIDAVLPALGEADATVLATPGRLYPGIDATGTEAAEVAAVKGDLRMAQVLNRAVRDRQRQLTSPVTMIVEGTRIVLRPADVRAAHDRARRSGRPHNDARVTFVKHLLNQLANQLAGTRDLDAEDRAGRIADLRDSRHVRRELNGLWPPLSPERLLRDLFAQPARLESAGRMLSEAERARLARDRSAPWTPADVPLLDEAAELLGGAESANPAAGPSEADLEVARRTLDDSEAGAMMSADQLAARWATETARRSVAEHAATDREWAFGHVVVDEAQELGPMTWRLLMRRCPSRSMTIVGDLVQTGALGGVRSWAGTLRPYVQARRDDRDPHGQLPDPAAADGPGRGGAAGGRRGGVRTDLGPVDAVGAGAVPGGRRGRGGAGRGGRRAGAPRHRDDRGAGAARVARAGRGGGRGAGPGRGADRGGGEGAGVRRGAAGRAGRRRRATPPAASTTSTSRSPGPPSGCTCCTPTRCRPGSDPPAGAGPSRGRPALPVGAGTLVPGSTRRTERLVSGREAATRVAWRKWAPVLDPNELYELAEELPELDGPVLVVAMTGFVDAAGATRIAAEHLRDQGDPVDVAVFDVDQLYDYRARRPAMMFVEDHWESYDDPFIRVQALTDTEGTPVPAARRPGAGRAVGAVRGRGRAALRAARGAGVGRVQLDPDGRAAHPPARRHRARQPAGADRRPPALAAAGAGPRECRAPAGVPARSGRQGRDGLRRARAALPGPDRLPGGRADDAGRGVQGDRAVAGRAVLEGRGRGRPGRRGRPGAAVRGGLQRGPRAGGAVRRVRGRAWDNLLAGDAGPLPTADELGAELERFLAEQTDRPDQQG